jgi:hypothetical protein
VPSTGLSIDVPAKSAIERIGAAEHFNEVKKAGEDEDRSFDALLSAMAEEAKKPRRSGTDMGSCSRRPSVPSPKN